MNNKLDTIIAINKALADYGLARMDLSCLEALATMHEIITRAELKHKRSLLMDYYEDDTDL